MLAADVDIQVLAAEQGGVVTSAQALQLGMSKSGVTRRIRAGQWRSLGHALLFVDPGADEFTARCWAGVLATRRDNPALSHLTAAKLLGIRGLPPDRRDEPIHLCVSRELGRAQRPGLRLHWTAVPADQLVTRTADGVIRPASHIAVEPQQRTQMRRSDVIAPATLPITSITRTLVDLALTTDRLTAVSTAEWAVQKGIDISVLSDLAEGRRGARRIQPWWDLVEPKSANRLETCARLLLTDAGLPPDAVQHPIYQDGRVVFVGDMAYIAQRVIVETDGRGPHTQPEQFVWDRRRLAALREAGWIVIVFTWADMQNPAYMAQTVRRALALAA